MIPFLMTLLVMCNLCTAPGEAGWLPEEKPPDLDLEKPKSYATAFYWEMYGASTKQQTGMVTE